MISRRHWSTQSEASWWPAVARAVLVAAGLAVPLAVHAQSNLSSQGFGFPTGQFSSRTQGTGGALAELDPFSPINPATIADFGSRILFFQMEPEYRSVKTGAGTERTTTARYPLVFGAMPLGGRLVVSLAASSLLDRTSTTSFRTIQTLETGEQVPMTTTYDIDGGIEDVRFALGWAPRPWLRVGAGAHAITGSNRVDVRQAFDDSATFAPFEEQRVLGYHGTAGSFGVELITKQIRASSSIRLGGRLRLSSEDTLLSTANVPARFGASLAYVGFTNTTIAVRTSRVDWSSMGSLGTPGLHGVDSWDTSIGADLPGPTIGGRIVFLRTGFRTRTLPFQASDRTVHENSVSAGIGTAFARGRILTDLAVIRASRNADLPATEHAWTISLGISVRP